MNKVQRQKIKQSLYAEQDFEYAFCIGKEKLSFEIAQKISFRDFKKPRTTFKCKSCGFYHIGSKR